MIGSIDIARAFTFVMDKGFTLCTATYSPQEFGNTHLMMEGAPFSIRLERDRGQGFVNIGNDAVGWHRLEYVLEFLDSSITQQQLGEPPDITLLGNLLQGHWDQVVELFNSQQKERQLEKFAQQKTANYLSKIFGKL